MKHCIKDSVHSNESHSLFKNFSQKKKNTSQLKTTLPIDIVVDDTQQ